ncbi:hypothetical protein B4U80_14026 [Leptotrombidium deliense]|uniref:MD-2-related lipid-recognition domain-containing protein n=1 Tax=Leptotrombidium deliense TaxID=299467 RepID=A0A443S4P9_9ACAR|nr:hypothetical protein B4U80_14026 [Leptotrombidium deliense]
MNCTSLFLIIFMIANAKEIVFNNCGLGNIFSINIQPCDSSPCGLYVMEEIIIEILFQSPFAAKTAFGILKVIDNSFSITLKLNACSVMVKCPLSTLPDYLRYRMVLPNLHVANITTIFQLIDDDVGTLVCFNASFNILNRMLSANVNVLNVSGKANV